jgi:hypothetical protein
MSERARELCIYLSIFVSLWYVCVHSHLTS